MSTMYTKIQSTIIDDETKNNDEALKWYKKAADQGHEEAKKAIDRMQGGGLGSAVAAGAALAGVGLLWKILNS